MSVCARVSKVGLGGAEDFYRCTRRRRGDEEAPWKYSGVIHKVESTTKVQATV